MKSYHLQQYTDIEFILLSQITQARKDKYHMNSFMRNLPKLISYWSTRLGKVVGREGWEEVDQLLL
jgi:hypothetical protein